MRKTTVDTDSIFELYERGFSLIPLGTYDEIPPAHFIDRYDGDVEAAKQAWPKAPRIPWKQYQARSASTQEIEYWIKSYPCCNWGIVTGKEINVVDADSDEAVQYVLQNLTKTPWAVTTGKGKHFYYQANEKIPVRNSTNEFLKVDARGHGGYVVAPGSIHPDGTQYAWDINNEWPVDSVHDLPTLADEDIQKITANSIPSPINGGGNLNFDATRVNPGAGVVSGGVNQGGRNNALATMVGGWVSTGLSIDQINSKAQQWNQSNSPPMAAGEVQRTIASICATHMRNQAAKPITPTIDPKGLLIPLSELQAQPPSWLIKGVIPLNSIGVLFGPSSGGKSFAALDMGLNIAAGRDWHGRKNKHQGGVIYVCGEGQQGVANRVRAWEKHHGEAIDNLPFRVTRGPIRFLDDGDKQALMDAVDTADIEPTMIVIDTLNRNFGDGDENSTKDMTRFVDAVTDVYHKFQCTILIVHHTNLTDGDRARGNGSLRNSCDFEIKHAVVSGEDDAEKVFSLVGKKMKDGAEMVPVQFALKVVNLGIDEDGDDYGSCIIELVPGDIIEGKEIAKKLVKGNAANLKKVLNELQRIAMVIVGNKPDIDQILIKKTEIGNVLQNVTSSKQRRYELRKKLLESGVITDNVTGGMYMKYNKKYLEVTF